MLKNIFSLITRRDLGILSASVLLSCFFYIVFMDFGPFCFVIMIVMKPGAQI